MELKGFTKLNETVSPELLKDEELTKLEDAVLDKELGRPLKRNGWARFNTNQVDATGTMASLDEVVTGQPKAIVKTVTSVVSGTGGVARFTHATGIAFPVGTTITNSTFGVGGYNVSQDVTVSATTYYELTVAYSSDSTGIGTPVTTGKNYLLAGINSKLRKSLDGTGVWSDITSKGTPPYRMQAYADNFIFTEGSVAPFIVSDNTLSEVNDLEIVAPDISSMTSGVNEGGSLESFKAYKWIMVYITLTGEVSPPSTPFSSHYLDANIAAYTHTTTGLLKRVGFQGLPVSSDARVTGRIIYRTFGDGEIYYFHSQLDNIITEWYDEASDDDLGSGTFDFLNIPLTAEYVFLHKERIIFGNIGRKVKNWVMPPHSKKAAAGFDVTYGDITQTFVVTSAKGIKDCTAIPNGGGITGTLTPGAYTHRFIFYNQEGLMSDPIDTNEVYVDGSTNKTVAIWTPPQIADSYDVITRAEIYRKKDAGNFELVKTYNPQTLALTILYSQVGGIFDMGWTATTTYTTNQVTESEKCGLAFSQIGQPASYVLEDIKNIFPDDGDEITGIYDDQDGIIIFKERSICKIFTGQGSPDNWRLVKLLTNIGCDEPNSLLKFGNDYVFSHQKMIYLFNSSSGLKKLGLEIIDSLKLVTAYHCATADDNWYIIGVTGTCFTSGFGFLIFDRVVGSWYLFNITSIPYVARVKEQGASTGTILTSNVDYILKYGTGTVDSNTGSNVDIVPIIRTKTFGDGISLERLRKIRFNYKKIDSKTLTITVVNPDTVVTNTHADTDDATDSSDFKLYEDNIGDSDSLKITPKFYIKVTGAGFAEWGTLRLETKPILRGKRNV